MKILKVSKKNIDYKDYVKRSAKEGDYSIFIKEPTTLVDADTNEILVIFDILPDDTTDVVRALNKIRYDTTKRVGGLKTTSRIFGFSPRVMMRKDFCSSTALAIESPVEHQMICDLGMQIERYYREYSPEGYKRHGALTAEKVLPEYRINKESIFTSGIINKNNPLKYHFDTGNFKDVYSCMVVFKKGIEGGYLSVPEYDVGFELCDNSLLMFDGQSLLHGVTPIRKTSPHSIRYSIVYYSLRQMWNCLTIDEELARIRNRKSEREKKRHSKHSEEHTKELRGQNKKKRV
jgi:hypothetical protein